MTLYWRCLLALVGGIAVSTALLSPVRRPQQQRAAQGSTTLSGFGYDALSAATTSLANTRVAALHLQHVSAGGARPSLPSIGVSLATKAGPAIVRGGETSATAYGRAIHKTFDYGPGFEREVRLPSGRRADAVNFETREIVELKPNNPRAITSGRRQVGRYADELNREFPGRPFTTRVETYDRP